MFNTDWIGPSIQSLDAARQQWWNYQEARHVERYNAAMSGSAMQRRVEDLRAAGLNPILAADQGGASSPSGVVAPSAPADVGGAINSALALKRFDKEMTLLDEQISNVKSDTAKKSTDYNANLEDANNRKIVGQGLLLDNLYKAYGSSSAKNVYDVQKSDFGGVMKYVRELTDALGLHTSMPTGGGNTYNFGK